MYLNAWLCEKIIVIAPTHSEYNIFKKSGGYWQVSSKYILPFSQLEMEEQASRMIGTLNTHIYTQRHTHTGCSVSPLRLVSRQFPPSHCFFSSILSLHPHIIRSKSPLPLLKKSPFTCHRREDNLPYESHNVAALLLSFPGVNWLNYQQSRARNYQSKAHQ